MSLRVWRAPLDPSLRVLLRVLVERGLASRRAEVVLPALVLGSRLRSPRVHLQGPLPCPHQKQLWPGISLAGHEGMGSRSRESRASLSLVNDIPMPLHPQTAAPDSIGSLTCRCQTATLIFGQSFALAPSSSGEVICRYSRSLQRGLSPAPLSKSSQRTCAASPTLT